MIDHIQHPPPFNYFPSVAISDNLMDEFVEDIVQTALRISDSDIVIRNMCLT